MKKIIFFILFFTQLTAYAQLPNYVPANGIIGFWQFNNNLQNSAANQYNGYGNLYNYTTDRAGNNLKALDFAAIYGNYARVDNIPVNTAGPYTLNFWMYLKTYNSYDIIVDFHPGNTCGNYCQIWEYADSINTVQCNIASSKIGLGHKSFFTGTWRMVTQVVNNDSTSIYIDGQLLKKIPYIWDVSTQANLILGNGTNSNSSYTTASNVKLDDIGLWNRTLDACEISALFNSGMPAVTTQPISQSVHIGNSATFTAASNMTNPVYQWQTRFGNGNFTNIINGGQYSGATVSILTVSGVLATNNNQEFRCIITGNTGCSIFSDTALLTVSNVGINNVNYTSDNILQQNVPNPANGNTTINYHVNNFNNTASIILTDITGKMVRQIPIYKTGNGSYGIGSRELNNGVYFYSLMVDGIRVATRKMVIYN